MIDRKILKEVKYALAYLYTKQIIYLPFHMITHQFKALLNPLKWSWNENKSWKIFNIWQNLWNKKKQQKISSAHIWYIDRMAVVCNNNNNNKIMNFVIIQYILNCFHFYILFSVWRCMGSYNWWSNPENVSRLLNFRNYPRGPKGGE